MLGSWCGHQSSDLLRAKEITKKINFTKSKHFLCLKGNIQGDDRKNISSSIIDQCSYKAIPMLSLSAETHFSDKKHFYFIKFPILAIVSTEKFSAAKLLLEVVWLKLIKSSVIRFTWIKGGKNKQAYWQRTKYKDSSSSFHSNQALAPLPYH